MDFKIDFSGTWTGGIPAVGALDFALPESHGPLASLACSLPPVVSWPWLWARCYCNMLAPWILQVKQCHLWMWTSLSGAWPLHTLQLPSSSKTKPQPPRYSFLPSSFLPCGRVSSIDLLFFARNQTDYWVSNDDPVIIFLVPFSAPLSSPKCLNGSLTCML